MKRWAWVLTCGHNILADRKPRKDEVEFCRGCYSDRSVDSSYVYMDEDLGTYEVPAEVNADA